MANIRKVDSGIWATQQFINTDQFNPTNVSGGPNGVSYFKIGNNVYISGATKNFRRSDVDTATHADGSTNYLYSVFKANITSPVAVRNDSLIFVDLLLSYEGNGYINFIENERRDYSVSCNNTNIFIGGTWRLPKIMTSDVEKTIKLRYSIIATL